MKSFDEIIIQDQLVLTDDIIEMLGIKSNIFNLIVNHQLPYTCVTYVDTLNKNFPNFPNLKDEIYALEHQPKYHPKLAKYVRIDKVWVMIKLDNFKKFLQLCPEISQEIKNSLRTFSPPSSPLPPSSPPLVVVAPTIPSSNLDTIIEDLIAKIEVLSLTEKDLCKLDVLVNKLEDLRITAYKKSFESKGEQECRRIA